MANSCIGAPPARTSWTPRSYCRCARRSALVESDLARLIAAIAELALAPPQHADGRANQTAACAADDLRLQGRHLAVWSLAPRQRLSELKPRVLQVQVAGAVGNLASLGAAGPDVRTALAAELDARRPLIAWHVVRDTLAETVGFPRASLCEPEQDRDRRRVAHANRGRRGARAGRQGHGASSTMPHKRNPIICEQILGSGIALASSRGRNAGCLHPRP